MIVAPGDDAAAAGSAGCDASRRCGVSLTRRGGRSPAAERAAATAALSSSRTMATATYVYCLVQSARKAVRRRACRPGCPVPTARSWREIDASTLARPCAMCRSITTVQDRSRRRCGDLDWVSSIAVAHEAVVEHFAPLRGVTVDSDEAVHDVLESRARDRRDARGAGGELAAPVRASCKAARSGACGCCAAAVERKRRRPPSRRAAPRFSRPGSRRATSSRDACAPPPTAADAAYASLAEIAADHRRRAGEAPGVVPPLLDAAFLVPMRRRARFQAAGRRRQSRSPGRAGR